MEKSALTNITENLTQPEKNFVSDLKHLAGEARRQAYRSADHLLVVRNWLIGWRIVTQEQNGKERAKYGKHVLELASQTLTEEYGRGFGLTSIKNMRSFYLMFSKLQIGQAMLDQFKLTDEPIRQAPLDEPTIPFYPNLSWLHYERLLRVKIQGKLVPQDPHDEPASVLLDKIRQENERLIKEKKIKRDNNASIIYHGEDNSYYEVRHCLTYLK